MPNITAFEKRILDACLAGDHPKLGILRTQLNVAKVTNRTYTGCGAYIDFSIPDSAPRMGSEKIIISDVNLEISGIPNGLATLLYVQEGKIQFLEMATYCDDWPEDAEITNVGYLRERRVSDDTYEHIPTKERDAETINRALGGRQSPDAV